MDFIKGFDLSTLPEVERCGGKFYDGGVPDDALKILHRYGGNYVRLRLWNDPYSESGEGYGAGNSDLPTLLAMAKRVKDENMQWLLDLHYSDFWADPGKQILPKAWRGMTAAQLEQAVYDFTMQTLVRCKEAGVPPQMVQPGNELSNGLLWPYGKVPEYEQIARFVKAGVQAVRDFDASIPVMVHLDNGGNNALYRCWFDHYFEFGGMCDVIGMSYYPLWHGSIDELRTNMHDVARRYGKDIVLVETSSYFSDADYARYEKLAPDQRKGAPMREDLRENLSYPMTPTGQAEFIRRIMNELKQVPDGRGKGFFWWEAAWIPVPGSGWANKAGWEYVGERGPGGNEWANQCLFDYDGNALPALETIRDF